MEAVGQWDWWRMLEEQGRDRNSRCRDHFRHRPRLRPRSECAAEFSARCLRLAIQVVVVVAEAAVAVAAEATSVAVAQEDRDLPGRARSTCVWEEKEQSATGRGPSVPCRSFLPPLSGRATGSGE